MEYAVKILQNELAILIVVRLKAIDQKERQEIDLKRESIMRAINMISE